MGQGHLAEMGRAEGGINGSGNHHRVSAPARSLAFFVAQRLLAAMANRLAANDAQRRSMKVAGAVFGAIALAPSIFLAMMVGGGSVAGRYAGMASRALGLGEAGAFRFFPWA